MAKIPTRINASKRNLEEITKAAADKKSAVEIEIDSIKKPKYHDRKYIDTYSIYELSESIKATNGLISPIVVRELSDGSYERVVGYRRIEAYKILKKKTIPAIILKDITDEQAILLMTSENMQRENLSPYDETLAILDYISVSLGKTTEETIKILTRFKNYNAGNITLKDEEKRLHSEIESILKKTGRLTISSVVNRFPMLNMNPIIKEELSKGSISFSNAKILNSIEDDEILKQAIEYVKNNNLSKRETAQYIKELIKPSLKKENPFKKILKDFSKVNIESLPQKKRDDLEDLFKKIEDILIDIQE